MDSAPLLATLGSLLTLTALEILLGIDNIIFLSILAAKLPVAQRPRAQRIGLLLAVGSRLCLLSLLSWVMRLRTPLGLPGFLGDLSGRDLILLVGGLFLMAKSTIELHGKLEATDEAHGDVPPGQSGVSFRWIVLQIALLDMVFSLDSVITAVGMAGQIWVMVAAVLCATGVMLAFAPAISRFVQRHPTMKVLALSFLMLIGFTLVADGLGQHIPRGYLYFALVFSFFVELLNLRLRAGGEPIALRHSSLAEPHSGTP
ncbi:MAG: TerC family protein [Myxococcales bacterium]|nr:TerC family protein [Myxococcales bacterium]